MDEKEQTLRLEPAWPSVPLPRWETDCRTAPAAKAHVHHYMRWWLCPCAVNVLWQSSPVTLTHVLGTKGELEGR